MDSCCPETPNSGIEITPFGSRCSGQAVRTLCLVHNKMTSKLNKMLKQVQHD